MEEITDRYPFARGQDEHLRTLADLHAKCFGERSTNIQKDVERNDDDHHRLSSSACSKLGSFLMQWSETQKARQAFKRCVMALTCCLFSFSFFFKKKN